MEPFIGQIQAFGFNYAPRGWAFCNGQLLAISQNTALFSLLGTTYGGDGRNTFGLPDLRSRSIVHPGQGPGLQNIVQGQRSGQENVTLNTTNLPSHTHPVTASVAVSAQDGEENTAANFLAGHNGAFSEDPGTDNLAGVSATGGATGGNQSFPIRNPYLGIYYCIALQGVFPPRN